MLCEKGPVMMDIMAEMPKFPERQSALLKKAEATEGDATEASATKLRLQQQNSMALTVVSDPQTANGLAHPPILRPSVAFAHTVMHVDSEKDMLSQCVALLGKFIAVREPNIRYLGLENMTRMLLVVDVYRQPYKYECCNQPLGSS